MKAWAFQILTTENPKTSTALIMCAFQPRHAIPRRQSGRRPLQRASSGSLTKQSRMLPTHTHHSSASPKGTKRLLLSREVALCPSYIPGLHKPQISGSQNASPNLWNPLKPKPHIEFPPPALRRSEGADGPSSSGRSPSDGNNYETLEVAAFR